MLYGYVDDEISEEKIKLYPSCVLKSKISYIKEVEEGSSISYGRTFITKRKTKIATVLIGYADGIRRLLSNNGYVVINKKLYPIIGSVCMDSFMVDITELEDAHIGMDVYIWDNENITLEEVADRCNTISYEIISTISDRVARKYI